MSNIINGTGNIIGDNNKQIVGNNNSMSTIHAAHSDKNDKGFLKTTKAIVAIVAGIIAIISGLVAWLK